MNNLIKNFLQKNSRHIAFILGFVALSLITFLAFSFSEASFTLEDIEKNSAKWNELERVRVVQQEALDVTVKAQKDLEAENNLLRQLFTVGEIPKK